MVRVPAGQQRDVQADPGVVGQGLEDVLVLGGGIIPTEDVDGLIQAGIRGIFGPGTDTTEIVKFIETNVRQ